MQFPLFIITQISRTERDAQQEFIFERDSEELTSSSSKNEHNEERAGAGGDCSGSQGRLVKTATHLELWWCPFFH